MSDQNIIFAEDVDTGKPIETTVKKIIINRVLIEGDSGSGKSHDVTTLVEKTDKQAQRIIIDIEGEYFPLKDNFQFLLLGKKNDIITPNLELNLNDIYVDKLAKKLIEKSADTIIDLSETPNAATHFVAVFFPALLKYAKLLKRPLLLFVDEAHVYAPEKGTGNEESLKAMIEMAKRGRKRGIGLICATQAMADFSKNVVRQLKIRVIGNCTYDKDVKSACDYLGFNKDREDELKNLAEDHHFFIAATGNAITIGGQRPKSVPKVKFLKNKTKLYDFDFGKSFKINEKDSGAIRDIAAEFSDIPQEIDQELTDRERLGKENLELRAKSKELSVRIIQLEKGQPKQIPIDPQALQKARQQGFDEGVKQTEKIYKEQLTKADVYYNRLKTRLAEVQALADQIKHKAIVADAVDFKVTQSLTESVKLPTLPIQSIPRPVPMVITKSANITSDDGTLTSAERKILTAIVQRPSNRGSRNQIAVMAGYEPNGGHFKNTLGALRTKGFIEYQGDDLIASDQGISTLGDYTPLPTDSQSIQQFWFSKLPTAEARILQVVCQYYPSQISREELASQAQFTSNGGHFKNSLGHLRSTGLVDYVGDDVKATSELFPMELTA